MLRLFTHRKTTLLFVIRDKTKVSRKDGYFAFLYHAIFRVLIIFLTSMKTPLEYLEPILRDDIQKVPI